MTALPQERKGEVCYYADFDLESSDLSLKSLLAEYAREVLFRDISDAALHAANDHMTYGLRPMTWAMNAMRRKVSRFYEPPACQDGLARLIIPVESDSLERRTMYRNDNAHIRVVR